MNKKSLVVQSNSLIEAKHRLSAEEQKIIKILISQIEKDDEDFKEYTFRIKDLAELLGMAHTNTYGVLREITKRLISRVLEFHNKETNRLLQASWLSSAEYLNGEGTVVLSFDPKLKPLLLELKACFTKYELEQVLRFTGQYTIRFFELRKMYLGQNKTRVFFEIERLYWMLGLGKDEYRAFKDFKRRVLKPAQLELSKKTGESFSWGLDKRGRGAKIHGIWLIFNEEKQWDDVKQVSQVQYKNAEIEKTSEKRINQVVVELLTKYGISRNIAEELANQYEESYIREKIAIAEANTGELKNRAGFIIQAIKENWVDADIVRMRQEEMRRNAQKEASEHRKRLQGIWDRYKMEKHTIGFVEFERRTWEERERLKKEFLSGLNNFMRNIYQKKQEFGYEDGTFRNFFLQKLENIPTFDMYLVAEGVTLSDEERGVIENEIAR